MLFEKQGAVSGSLTEVKYLCVCNACKRVYAYKASDGSGFGDMKFCDRLQQRHHLCNERVINAGRVGSTILCTRRVGSGRVTYTTSRVGSGPEKSDPWSTLHCPHRMRSLVLVMVEGPSVCPTFIYLFRQSTAAVACGGFAAQSLAGKRYRSIATGASHRPEATAPLLHDVQQQMRAVSSWQPKVEAEHTLVER